MEEIAINLLVSDPVDQSEAWAVEDIKGSIVSMGMLFHPLTVVPVYGGRETEYFVRAGKKRLRACRDLGWKSVPCVVVPPTTSPEKIEEISIHENLKRANLEWWAKADLEKKLHEMRQQQHGVGRQGKKSGWSLRDTALELGEGLGTLSENIRLADAVMANPNLRKIKDRVTARRLILQTQKRIDTEEAAAAPNSIEYNTCYCGDASEILKFFPDNTFDVCFTDPPWLDYKDPTLVKDDKTILVFKELYRVMKWDSFLYVICSTPDFFIYLQEFPKFGWKVQHMPLIWHKLNVVSHGLRPWEYNRDYEPILLAVKGSPVLVNSGRNNSVYSSPAVHPTRLIHPNEKPTDVPAHFLEHCSYEGSMVIDPFGGSGCTAEACKRSRRRYVIIERDKKFADGIERRLAGVVVGEGPNSPQEEVRSIPQHDEQEDSGGSSSLRTS